MFDCSDERLGEILVDLGKKRKLAESARSIFMNVHQRSVKAELEQIVIGLDAAITQLEEDKAAATCALAAARAR